MRSAARRVGNGAAARGSEANPGSSFAVAVLAHFGSRVVKQFN